MNFDVVALDIQNKPEVEAELSNMRVPLIVGDARQPETLERAGLRHAQALIVCTADDFLNLEIAVRARDLNGAMRLVVRMWDDQFASHLKQSLDAETVSASDLAAPAFAGMAVGVDIAPTFHIHQTDYSLIRLQVASGSFMEGRTIAQLQDENEIDIVLHEHDGQVDVHPAGTTHVQAGNTLVVFARHLQITEIVARNRTAGAMT
jgi:Trk K+ transport system NAD-binding subunit